MTSIAVTSLAVNAQFVNHTVTVTSTLSGHPAKVLESGARTPCEMEWPTVCLVFLGSHTTGVPFCQRVFQLDRNLAELIAEAGTWIKPSIPVTGPVRPLPRPTRDLFLHPLSTIKKDDAIVWQISAERWEHTRQDTAKKGREQQIPQQQQQQHRRRERICSANPDTGARYGPSVLATAFKLSN